MSSNGSKTQQPILRVIPLGGLHEIGKNTCVFEFGDDLVLIDAGLAFPSDGMHGVNVVMPDTSFLRENQKRIRGMICLLYTSPSPRDATLSRMPSSA